jgi:hypothetical protein
VVVVTLSLAALLAGVLGVPPTHAACDGPAPSFSRGVGSADTVVVGEVTAAERLPDVGFAREFTLRVDHVLRGVAPPVMRLQDVVMQPCAGVILVNGGDMIAIAFGAREFDMDVNAVAFLRGAPSRGDIEQLTLAEVFSLAGQPIPTNPDRSLGLLWIPGLVAALVGAGAVAAFRRRGPQSHPA